MYSKAALSPDNPGYSIGICLLLVEYSLNDKVEWFMALYNC